MYMSDGVSIGKADDGTFLINFRIKKKADKKSKGSNSDKGMPMMADSMSMSEEKTLTAKNEQEVIEKLKPILTTLEKGCMPEEEFGKAFSEAAGGDES